MDNKFLISVVIPVYNAQDVVHRAVESVLHQMNDQVELILVDDGAKDNSGAICDEYSRKYPCVKVVHKINGGLSSARNAGMAVAEGEYIVFLDADDYLAPNACEELAKVMMEHHPDCIDYGWNYVNVDGGISSNFHKLPKDELLDKQVIRNVILPPLLHLNKDDDHFIFDFAWLKVYRRQIVEENSVYFDEGRRIWEDRPFVAQYLKYCKSYYSIGQCLYYYLFTEGSLGQRYSLDFLRIIRVTFQHYLHHFDQEYDFNTQYVNDYWCGAIENMIYRSLDQTQNQDIIRQNILTTLRDPQVVYWYEKRQCRDAFDEKIKTLVVSGEAESALSAYEKKAEQRHRHQKRLNMKNRMKGYLKGILRRVTGK